MLYTQSRVPNHIVFYSTQVWDLWRQIIESLIDIFGIVCPSNCIKMPKCFNFLISVGKGTVLTVISPPSCPLAKV